MQIGKCIFNSVLWVAFFCYGIAGANPLGLLPPTGNDTVGYRDDIWINHNECPDPYFKNNHLHDSDSYHPKHCREIIVTVFYPAEDPVTHYSPYYRPAILYWEQEFAKLPANVRPTVHMREQVWIQAGKNLKPMLTQKFPVVLFAPGFETNGNEYSNLLVNLASHGYIVFAVNSTFSGKATWSPKAWDTAKKDILFVRDKLTDLQNDSDLSAIPANRGWPLIVWASKAQEDGVRRAIAKTIMGQPLFAGMADNLLPPMNLEQIALVGHSMGGLLTVDLAHKKPTLFQAAIALDASYEPQWSDPHAEFVIPFLHMHAADWATRMPRKYAGFILGQNEYFVTLSPNKNQKNDTHHLIFSDYSTLQYLPEAQTLLAYYHTDVFDVGTADGKKMQSTISNYLVTFLDRYLKNKPDTRLEKCLTLSQDTRMVCGPGWVSNSGDKNK